MLLDDADNAFHEKNYQKALEIYQLALKEDPNDPRIYQGLGQSLYNLKQFDDAILNGIGA